jgi:(p)ppGpp synthase/HD superfamily hydrolase
MTLIDQAIEFAAYAHRTQKRKGTKTPYISHPYAVGMILQHPEFPIATGPFMVKKVGVCFFANIYSLTNRCTLETLRKGIDEDAKEDALDMQLIITKQAFERYRERAALLLRPHRKSIC